MNTPDDELNGLRVLIALDEEAAALDLAHLLEAHAASATLWQGTELAEELKRGGTDVLVLAAESDGQGLSLCDQLLEAERDLGVRVCVASAQVDRDTLEIHAGTVSAADAYLRMPFREELTVACLQRLAEGAPTGPERLWWLDDRSEPPPEPPGAAGSGSGSPVGVPGFKF